MIPISIIDNALRAEDVEGLLELGAPNDEYSHEAKTIASELEQLTPGTESEDGIAAVIAKVWAKSFELSDEDLDKRYSALRRVARQILASYSEHTTS
jgi:hypothetical protein